LVNSGRGEKIACPAVAKPTPVLTFPVTQPHRLLNLGSGVQGLDESPWSIFLAIMICRSWLQTINPSFSFQPYCGYDIIIPEMNHLGTLNSQSSSGIHQKRPCWDDECPRR
jgi:hypothetical protein